MTSFTRMRALMLAALLVVSTGGSAALQPRFATYPPTRRDVVVEELHGIRIEDPYRWLEQLDAPAVAEWVRAQNEWSHAYLARLSGRDGIRHRLATLWNYSRTRLPQREAGRIFYRSNSGLQPQYVLYAQRAIAGTPTAILDPNEIWKDGSIEARDFVVSPDGRLLAYATARGGADAADVRVRDLSLGRDLADRVPGAWGEVCWTGDSRGFFYMRPRPARSGEAASDSRLEKQVLYHLVGRPASDDRVIHEWPNYQWIWCMLTEDGRFATITANRGPNHQVYAIDLRHPTRPRVSAPLVEVLGGQDVWHMPIGSVGDTLYAVTGLDAPRGRVIAIGLADGNRARPRVVIPESPDVIEDAAIAGRLLAVHYQHDVKSRLRLFTLEGTAVADVPLPGIGSIGGISGRSSSWDLFYSFEAFLSPPTIYHYDHRTGANRAFQPPTPPFDAGPYETRQFFYRSKDGTRVPMFVTARKDLPLDGSNPTLLTAYGGYGSNSLPAYLRDLPLWLDAGGVYAVANIRGGGEYGEAWHRDGMRGKKQNSFDDFIAAAEHLIQQRLTSPAKLAIYGHSNGGLLVGAVVTQRPDLFAAAIANAGHHDMLRFHKFTVGAGWIPEYGSPDDPGAFQYLRRYSPLHNVRDGTCYPATLLLAADHDDRVVPSHSYKFAAALQQAQSCNRPIVLRVAVDAAHGYASTAGQLAERADMWAFIGDQLRVTVRQ